MYGNLLCRLEDANITTRFITTAVIMHIIANGDIQYDKNVLVPSFMFPFIPDSFDCCSTASENESMSLRINQGDSDAVLGSRVAAGVVIDKDAALMKVDECIPLVEIPTLL